MNQERGGNNQQQTNVVRDLQLKRIISFLVAIISMASAIPLAFLNGAQDIRAKHSPTVIKAYNFLIWSTLLSPILLLMYALFRSGRSDRIDRNQNIYLISTITIPCALLIMTSFFSIILLNKEYSAVMSLIVIPVIAIICFLGYAATRKVGDNDSTDHESYKREQKKAFKFSTTISSMAITVQTGMIYASFKSPPLQALQSFQIGLSLFFLISTVGILVMMVTSIPLTTVRYTFWSGRPLIFVRCSSAFILGLLGLSAIALAMQFLGSLVSGVFLLVHVLIFVYFALEHFGIGLRDTTSANDLYKDPDNAGVIRYGITAMVSFNCGLLAAICVVSVGIAQQNYYINLWLRVCTFFQLLAIESGLIWIGLMFEPHYSEMCASIIEIFHFVSLLLEIVMIMAGAVMLFIVLS